MAGSKKFNESITGLRGLASIMVVLFHIWAGAIKDRFLPKEVPLLVADGLLSLQHGVELFFLISGYLIVRSVARHGDALMFLKDRALRIYPAFLPVLILIFALGAVSGYSYFDGVKGFEWVWLFILNALFVPGVYPMDAALLVAWTLSYEAAFYVYCAIAFSLHNVLPKPALKVMVVISSAIAIWFYPLAIFFAAGVAVHYLYKAYGEPKFSLSVFAVPALLATIWLAHMGYGKAEEPAKTLYMAASAFFGLIFFASVVADEGIFCRALKTRTMLFLGAISYSLYLWHTPIMFATKRISMRFFGVYGPEVVFISFALSSLFLSIVTAWISFKVLEQKKIRFLNFGEATRARDKA